MFNRHGTLGLSNRKRVSLMNLDHLNELADLDERINSPEFQQALKEKDFKELNDIFNNTPSENTLAETGRFPD